MAEPDRPAIMIEVSRHAEFAQDQDADEVDDEDCRAEPPQLENALLRDDRADKKIYQDDDGDAAKRNRFNVGDQRSRPEIRRLRHASADRGDHRAEKLDPLHQIAASVHDAFADIGAERDQKMTPRRRCGASKAR